MKRERVLWLSSLTLALAACGQSVQNTTPQTGARAWAAYLPGAISTSMVVDPDLQDLAVRAEWLSQRPEMQEPDGLELLDANWREADFLTETEAPYYDPESPTVPPSGGGGGGGGGGSGLEPQLVEPIEPPPPPPPPPASPPLVLDYIKGVAWGSVDAYDREYAQQAIVDTRYPGQINWRRDGCSVPVALAIMLPSIPTFIIVGYRSRFEPACNLHDFGYTNIKVYERTSANRARIDDTFLGNMRHICRQCPWYQRPLCRGVAWTYHKGVRLFGSLYW